MLEWFRSLASEVQVAIVGALVTLAGVGGQAIASLKKGPAQTPTMQLAGAIISDKKADEIVEALGRQTAAIEENTDAVRALTLETARKGG